MERSHSLRKTAALFLCTLLVWAAASAPARADEVVLIASANSDIGQLDSLAVRKLFLGLTVIHDGKRLRPFLNEGDARLKDIFLQNVVSMSEMTYDRRVLSLVLQGGRSLPAVYDDTTKLLSALVADPTAVSYAWLKDVEHDRRIKIMRILWRD
jgi:hypothetical protein